LYKSFTISQAAPAAAARVERAVVPAPAAPTSRVLAGQKPQQQPLRKARQAFQSTPGDPSLRPWLAAIVLLGVGLRVAQYLAHQSLWGDEAYLILNVRGLRWDQLLTGRLTLAAMPQNCPPALLLILKLLDRRPDSAEWLLRLPSLLASCAALTFAALAARKILLTWTRDPILAARWACFPALAMALSDRMIFQSATVKQYSSDVFCSAVLMFAWASWRQSQRAPLKFSLLAAALVWVSLPAPMVYLPLALAMLIEQRDGPSTRWRQIVRWLANQLPFAVSLALLASTTLRNQADPQMWRLWAPALANWHHPLGIPLWLANRSLQLFAYPLGPLSNLLPFGLLGAAAMVRQRNWAILAGLAGPIAVLMFAGLARLYPLTGQRVTMFVAPFELMLATIGLVALAQISRRLLPSAWPAPAISVSLAAFMLAVPAILAVRHLAQPQSKGNLRQMIQTVAARREPADRVYASDSEADAVIRCYSPVSGPANHIASAGLLADGDLAGPALSSGKSCWLIVARDPSRPSGKQTPLPLPRGWIVGPGSVIANDGCAVHLLRND
jgi:hypothetical protein